MNIRLTVSAALSFLFTAATALSQGGYYISRSIVLQDTAIKTASIGVPISPNREDVKAIGMGRTQVADGKTFNAMMYNPALLSRSRTSFDVAGIQASLPPRTFGAISYLSDNKDQFKSGLFYKQIRDGLQEWNQAGTLQERLDAVQKINVGLAFLNGLQDKVTGPSDNPWTQGIGLIPNIQIQLGNWGFSLYGNVQSGFQVQSGTTVSDILALKLPAAGDITPELIQQLAAIVLPLIDPNGNLNLDNAMPVAYAVAYFDIVGAVGYARELREGFSVGANLKILNRRFSTKRIAPDNFGEIVSDVRKDFQASVTGFTMDLGALYRIKKTGTEIGLSLQNVIPVQTISSSATANFDISRIVDYDRVGGIPVVNAQGDTGLVKASQALKVSVPFELKVPFVANLGAVHPLSKNWDVALDWADIAAQDSRYQNYIERFRIGTEYRLEAKKDVLGIAFRGGLADKRFTVGLGLNFWRVVQLDGAYAYDQFVGDYVIFGQAKVGW